MKKIKKQRKLKNKRILMILLIILILLAVILNNKLTKKEKIEMSPEIARSLEYTAVQPEDKEVKDTSGAKVEGLTFDAFFLKDLNNDNIADSIRGTCNRLGASDTLYMELRVLNNGTFNDGVITINGSNFYLNTTIVKDPQIANNYIGVNTRNIKLNNIQNGAQKMITGIIRSGDYSNSYTRTAAIANNKNNYSKTDNSVVLTGTYVTESGESHQIRKEIPFTVDWYGEARASIQTTNIKTEVEDMNSLAQGEDLKLSFNVRTAETVNELLLKGAYIKGKIPELNNFKPRTVTITGNGVTFNYNDDTQEFTAQRLATVDSTGVITSTAYTSSTNYEKYNTYTINVTYPAEAYNQADVDSIELLIPVTAYYEAFNNPTEQFGEVYTTNEASSTVIARWVQKQPEGDKVYQTSYNITVGRYERNSKTGSYRYVVSKEKPLKIYNGASETEDDDYYTVRWYAFIGTNAVTDKLVMKEKRTTDSQEVVDQFITTGAAKDPMTKITANAGIYFSSPLALLGPEGWIKVIDDDTETELKTFTANDWNEFNSSNPFYYEEPVKHIRIETSKVNAESSIYVYNIKELDDNAIIDNYGINEFDNLQYIESRLSVYLGENQIGSTTHQANYEAPFSMATIQISQNTISTQEECKNQIITIATHTTAYNEQKWVNGSFIVKLPKEIIGVEINKVDISDGAVNILGCDVFEQDENYYIKILTENETESSYSIKIDCNITPDPRTSTVTRDLELYATNEQSYRYYTQKDDIYDVDGDTNNKEQVNYDVAQLSLVSPNSLLSNQLATNFDQDKTTAIAPRVAKIGKDQRKATVELNITNNYESQISDALIQGVIPFAGNKYVIGSGDLGSDYDANMVAGGITLPAELQEYAKVYYSKNATPTNDLTNDANGWIEASQMTENDWKDIKTFIIDLREYTLQPKDQFKFSYDIYIPNGVKYNEISYSEHAIYFSLETPAGKYPTSTGVSRLGFMIAKQYDLEIEKLQQNTPKKLPGITFSITEEGKETSTIRSTDVAGIITIPGLYVEKTYTIKEIRTTSDYVLDSAPIKFKVYENEETGDIYIKYIDAEGNESDNQPSRVKIAGVNQATRGEDYKIQIQIEDEVKAKLKIIKKDNETKLSNIRFRLNGKGKNNVTVTTNKDGEIATSGLYLNEYYELEEIRATGYYLIEGKIKFKITSEAGGNFNIEVAEGNDNISLQRVDTDDYIPTIHLEIGNNKIPTYNLTLTKYAEEEEDKLPGAQFKITGDGLPENGAIYTTAEDGTLTIEGLYEYVELDGTAKGGIKGEYTISEIFAPEGYALDSTPIKFRGKRNELNELQIEILEGIERIRLVENPSEEVEETATIRDYTVEGANTDNPVFKLSVEDPPIFELIKVDGDTTKPLPDAKFEIYELNSERNVVGSAKDINGNYVGTLEEGSIEITFPLTESSYTWTQKEDGAWQSENWHERGKETKSIMTSSQFTLIKKAKISFEWTVSSESLTYDYLFYTIQSTDGKVTIGGNKSGYKIGGNKKDTETYNELIWNKVEQELEAGTYTITFTYRKDSSGDKGQDRGYVRNVKVDTAAKFIITTDELGKASLNLPEGLYKLVEVEAPEGYDLPDEKDARSYYFGIGSSKPQEQAFMVEWSNQISGYKGEKELGEQWNKILSSYATNDGGLIAVGSIYNEADLDKDGKVDLTSEGRRDALVVKYDKDGKIEWKKNIGGSLNDEFNKVIQTSDGGYAIVGYFSSDDLNVEIEGITLKGLQDGILLKLNPSGQIEWGRQIAGTLDDYLYAVEEDNSGNLIVTGGFYSKDLQIPGSIGENLASKGEMDGIVVSFTNNGTYNWHHQISGTSDVQIVGATTTSSGYAVAVNFIGTITVNGTSVTSKGGQDGMVIAYDESGSYSWHRQIGGTSNEKLTGIITNDEGQLVVYGSYYSSTINLDDDTSTNEITSTKGYFDCMMITYTEDGAYTSCFAFGGSQDDTISEVVQTEDGDYLLSGWVYSYTIDINGDGVNDLGSTNTNFPSGFMAKIKENSDTTSDIAYIVEFADKINGSSYDEARTAIELQEGGYVVGGLTSSTALTVYGNENAMTTQSYEEGFLIKYNNVITSAEIPEKQSQEVKNYLKRFKITTEVGPNDTGERVGGKITGNYGTFEGNTYEQEDFKQYVETVVYHENSKEVILVEPEPNYSVTSIKINGVDYPFTPNSEGKVEIPIFTNVEQDKHIVVVFTENSSSVVVNHYLWKDGETTDEPIEGAPSEYKAGKVGDYYYTSPNTDTEYEIITNEDYYGGAEKVPEGLDPKDYYIPEDANGQFESEQKVVNYYYKERTYKLTVHHYLEDTDEPVPDKDGTPVDDEVTEGYKKNDSYGTSKSAKVDYSKYEVVEEKPEGSEGTILGDTEVTYYYRLKDSAGVIVKHHILNSEDQVPSKDGKTVQDEILPENGETAKVGDSYSTKTSDDIASNYRVATNKDFYGEGNVPSDLDPSAYYIPNNSEGEYKEELTEVTYYYVLKTAHIEDTIEKTGPDNIENPKDVVAYKIKYNTTIKDYIGQAVITITDTLPYEIDLEKTKDLDGGKYDASKKTIQWVLLYNVDTTIEPRDIEVVKNISFVYKNIDADLTSMTNTVTGNTHLSLTGDESSDTDTQVTTYNFKEDLTVTKVWGNNQDEELGIRPESVEVTLGATNAKIPDTVQKTVQLTQDNDWTNTFEGLPKYNEEGELIDYTVDENLEGNLKIIYSKEISKDSDNPNNFTITNTYSESTEQISITVDKVWDDQDNAAGKRPKTIQIRVLKVEPISAGESESKKTEVAKYTLDTTLEAEQQTHTFEHLAKYDNKGNEITYIVEESEVGKDELFFYTNEVTQNQENPNKYTITNTFTVPNDKISITAQKNWQDTEAQQDKRPGSLKIKLMDGENNVRTEVASQSNNWTVTFEELAKYDSNGDEIEYTVVEEAVEENDLYFYKQQGVEETRENNFVITNVFTVPQEEITITATKVWDDNSNTGKTRPNSIKLILTGSNGKTYEKTVNKTNQDTLNENNWVVEFKVPKFDENGNTINYTLSEEEATKGDLDAYIQDVQGNIATNTLIIKESGITKTGPATITSLNDILQYNIDYKMTLDGAYDGKATITIVDTLPYEIDTNKAYNLNGGAYDASDMTITWTGVYDANTNKITWQNTEGSVEEELPNDYIIHKKISLTYKDIKLEDTGTTITNKVTGTVTLDNGVKETREGTFDTTTDFTVKVKVNKIWKGELEANLPNEITVELNRNSNTGEDSTVQVRTIKLNKGNNWTYVWEDLPRYDAETREEIKYTVSESQVPSGYYLSNLEEIENTDDDRTFEYTITNSKYGSITITKVDSRDENIKLGGAEFKLEKLKDVNGELVVDESFTALTKETISEGEQLGKVEFTELRYGTYRLTETKAPQGYNLLRNPIDIELTESKVNYSGQVSDKQKTALPETGGSGRIMLIIFGLLMIYIVTRIKIVRVPVQTSNTSRKNINRSTKSVNNSKITRNTHSRTTKKTKRKGRH